MSNKMQLQVLGAKVGKGDFEGTKYDYTKVRVVMPVSDRSGNEVGFDSSDMVFGTSENYDQFKGLKYPLMCDVDILMTTKGFEIVGCKPVQNSRPA